MEANRLNDYSAFARLRTSTEKLKTVLTFSQAFSRVFQHYICTLLMTLYFLSWVTWKQWTRGQAGTRGAHKQKIRGALIFQKWKLRASQGRESADINSRKKDPLTLQLWSFVHGGLIASLWQRKKIGGAFRSKSSAPQKILIFEGCGIFPGLSTQ